MRKISFVFDAACQQHLAALKLQGKAPKTIEAYAFAVRRAAPYFDRVPDDLTTDCHESA